MKSYRQPCIVFLLLLMLAGCGTTGIKNSEVYAIEKITLDENKPSIIIADASKRGILMIPKRADDTSSSSTHYSCSEPPPDVIGSLILDQIEKMEASLNVKGKQETTSVSSTEGEVGLGGEREITDKSKLDINKLFERSQGIQALRDGMFRACEGHANGSLSSEDYKLISIGYISTLNHVVPAEVCAKTLKDIITDEAVAKYFEKVGADVADIYKNCLTTSSENATYTTHTLIDIVRDQNDLEKLPLKAAMTKEDLVIVE